MKTVIVAVAAALGPLFADGEIPGRLRDQCVGGEWDEIIAQAGVVSSRTNPEYGLSEKLALRCPMFVHTVLIAEWLGPDEKRRAFAEVPGWPPERRIAYFVELWARVMAEDRKAREEDAAKGLHRPEGGGGRTKGKKAL